MKVDGGVVRTILVRGLLDGLEIVNATATETIGIEVVVEVEIASENSAREKDPHGALCLNQRQALNRWYLMMMNFILCQVDLHRRNRARQIQVVKKIPQPDYGPIVLSLPAAPC